MMISRLASSGGATLLAASLVAAAACGADDRIGFEENFDSAEGWKVSYGAPIKSMTARDGKLRFETVRGALNHRMKRADWPEWPEKPFRSSTGMKKEYGRKVDLSKYRYLVVKLDERGTKVKLSVCRRWTPVCYTTGLRALDLRNVNLTGKQEMVLAIEFLNSSGVGTFDFIRLVSELTGEEKKVLMPGPVRYREEKRTAHPYHRLEAMNARCGRPRLKRAHGQLAVYRDTLSGAEVWKLTAQPGDQSLGGAWSPEGRFFSVGGGRDDRNVYDFAEAKWRKTRLAGGGSGKAMPVYHGSWPSRNHPGVTYGYRTSWHRPRCDFILYRYDAATGTETEFGRLATEGKWDTRELARASKGDVAAVGLRGTPHVWIIDPEAKDAAKRVRYVKLDSRLKGLGFIKDDTHLVWFNCYTYEQRQMALATGKVSLGYYTSGGHAGSGFGRTLRHYAGMTVVQPSGLTDWKAGDLVKPFAYFETPIGTDYGRLVDGGRWWLVNGTSRDVRNQHIMVDGGDCATILRLCGYNTSRNNWSTNTYSRCSPDATKVAWVSDQLGDGDVYFAVIRRPDPVRNLRATNVRGVVTLTWEAPERCQELAGYVVYGAGPDLRYVPMHEGLLTETKWTGKVAEVGGGRDLIVCAREWSGLESMAPHMGHHLAVALGERSATARLVVDGGASGFRAVRRHVASASEAGVKATVTWKPIVLPPGRETTFMRSRADDGTAGGKWTWQKLASGYGIVASRLTVEIPEGRLVDKVVVRGGANPTPPTGLGGHFGAPAAPTDARAVADRRGVVAITWEKPKELNISRVDVFTGGADSPLDNTTVIGTVPAMSERKFLDWGLKPGGRATYRLVSVDSRGNRSDPATLTVSIPKVEEPVNIGFTAEKIDTANPEHVRRSGEEMLAPKPTAMKSRPGPGDYVPLAFSFEVPVAGQYGVWVRYAPGYTSRLAVPVKIDGKDVGRWWMRCPYRPMSGTLARPASGKVKVFTDRLAADRKDLFGLAAGRHSLTLMLDPTIEKGNVHAVAKVWITSDPSFRAPGYDPRADFGK